MRALDPNTGRLRLFERLLADDKPPPHGGFFRGVMFAVPLSLACWALLIWAGTWLGHSGALP